MGEIENTWEETTITCIKNSGRRKQKKENVCKKRPWEEVQRMVLGRAH